MVELVEDGDHCNYYQNIKKIEKEIISAIHFQIYDRWQPWLFSLAILVFHLFPCFPLSSINCEYI